MKPIPINDTEGRGIVPIPLSGTGSAFTLVELLAVIAIIAVIAALAVPAISKAITTVNRAKSVSNIRQLGAAHLAYAIDHDGCLPPLSESMDNNIPPQTIGPWWPDFILPYLGYPSDYADSRRTQPKHFPDVYYNPLVKKHFPWTDFGVNRFVYYDGGVSFKLARIANLHTIMLMDAGPAASYEGSWMLAGATIAAPTMSNLAPRKDNKLSVVYFDGSAEVITRQFFIENSLKMAGPNYGL